MEEILFTILAMLICLIAEGFFSGSEIGAVSANRFKLRHDAAKGSKGAKLALQMLDKPEWLLSTTLVGTNISVVTNTTLATALVVNLFGSGYSWLAVVIVAPLIWLFGEIVPKSVFQQKADEITPRAIFLLKFFSYLFYPILIIFSFLTRVLTKIVGGNKRTNIFTLREQIISMLHLSGLEGDISPAQGKMIRQMFKFSETQAIHVMVPLVNVMGVEKNASCAQAAKLAIDSGFRNLVVYDQRVDNIIGMVHSLELLGVSADSSIEPYIRPVRYVAGGKVARELLDELRESEDAMAVVINEFGSARGIITTDDIMEVIVFEIYDEFDKVEDSSSLIEKVNDAEYLVSGQIELDYLRDKLGVEISKGDYSTLAGYLLQKSPEIPELGARIKSHGIIYQIENRTDRKIEVIRLILPSKIKT